MFGHHLRINRKENAPSFQLGIDREVPLQPWVLAEDERATALPEFLWSISALAENMVYVCYIFYQLSNIYMKVLL